MVKGHFPSKLASFHHQRECHTFLREVKTTWFILNHQHLSMTGIIFAQLDNLFQAMIRRNMPKKFKTKLASHKHNPHHHVWLPLLPETACHQSTLPVDGDQPTKSQNNIYFTQGMTLVKLQVCLYLQKLLSGKSTDY